MANRRTFSPAREQITSAASRARPQNLQFPTEDGNYGMLMIFRDYNYRLPGTRGPSEFSTSNGSDTIFLPLPTNLMDTFSVRVQRFDQGPTGAVISDVMSQASQNGLNISTFQDAATSAIMNNLPSALTDGAEGYDTLMSALSGILGGQGSQSLDRFSADAAFLLRRILPGDVGRSVDAGTGTFLNPKASLSFEGVEMKTHSFDWTLAPKSERETETLRNITQTIKRRMLPQYVEGTALQNVMFRYPSMVDIFFVGLDIKHYYFFKTAMVQTFSANYSPSGVSVLRSGRPAAVQLQMNVIESDIHTSEDYDGGGFSIEGLNFDQQNPTRPDRG